jgi:hypothetical protein
MRTLINARLVKITHGEKVRYEHYCPGCQATHRIAVGTPYANGANWTFNGDAETPTFSPSINVGPGGPLQCHYFIRAGQIEYCGDCHHDLKGQTVALPEIPQDWLL